MIIFINNPTPFEAAVILRTLYYSTKFSNITVYINGKIDNSSVLRYSRVPIYDFKKAVKYDIPVLDKNTIVVDPRSSTKIYNLNKSPDNIIIDFSGEYINRYQGVSFLGLDLLSYEAVSILYYLFIRSLKKSIPKINNEIDRDSLYIAKKLLLFVDSSFPNPKKLKYILQHIHKKWKILVEIPRYEIKGDYWNYNITYIVEFYDKNLLLLQRAKLEVNNDLFKIPIFRKNKVVYKEFFLDRDRRRVWISNDFYIEEKNKAPDLKDFFNHFMK